LKNFEKKQQPSYPALASPDIHRGKLREYSAGLS